MIQPFALAANAPAARDQAFRKAFDRVLWTVGRDDPRRCGAQAGFFYCSRLRHHRGMHGVTFFNGQTLWGSSAQTQEEPGMKSVR